MEISLRSQLAAGIAVAGAAAIAVTPIVQPDLVPSLQRVSANIQISAWADPLSVLTDTLGVLGNAFFGTAPNMTLPPPVSVPGLNGLLPIGDSGLYVRTTDGLIPQLLNGSGTYTADQLGPDEPFFVTKVGQVPGTPLLAAVGTNVSNYAVAGLNALGAISDATGALLFGLPLTAFQVIDDLVNGDPIDIGQIIQDTIITPLTDAFDTVITQTSYVINSVIDNVTALLSAVPALLTGVFQQVLGSTLFLGQQALNTVADSVTALASLDLQDAWNTTVNGFLGPNGVLGNAVKLSVGTGALTGDFETPFIPSLRQVLTVGTVGGSLAIKTSTPPPAAAVRAPRAAAALSASDVQAEVSADAPSTDAPAVSAAPDKGRAQAGSSGNASTPKASKHRVSRKAASE